METKQLEQLITATLKEVDLHSSEAVSLLLGTAAQESALGKYIRQLGNGPALGFFQMEPATFRDIIENFLYYKPILKAKVIEACNVKHLDADCLEYNLKVAIIFCRLHYLRVPEKLPYSIQGMAAYWKKHYNTHLGKGTEKEFFENFYKYIFGL
jgi:hypothetical protein